MAASESVRPALRTAGFELPASPQALGSYVPATRAGDLVFTSGQLPMLDGALLAVGVVGLDVEPQTANACARHAALNALAAASTVCDRDDVSGVVKLNGFVASAASLTGQPSVVNGASDVLLAAFGEAGKHARAAVGVAALPLGAPVEIGVVLQLR